jgi:hypothetical protein
MEPLTSLSDPSKQGYSYLANADAIIQDLIANNKQAEAQSYYNSIRASINSYKAGDKRAQTTFLGTMAKLEAFHGDVRRQSQEAEKELLETEKQKAERIAQILGKFDVNEKYISDENPVLAEQIKSLSNDPQSVNPFQVARINAALDAMPERMQMKKATVTEELKSKAAYEKQLNAYVAGQRMLDILDQVYDPKTGKTHPGFSGAIGAKGISSIFGLKEKPIAGTDAADAVALVDQIAGNTFLSGFEALKGGGAISNTEGEKAQAAAGRTSRDQTEEGYKKSLEEIRGTILTSMRRLEELGVKPSDGSQPVPLQQNQQGEAPAKRPIDILQSKISPQKNGQRN